MSLAFHHRLNRNYWQCLCTSRHWPKRPFTNYVQCLRRCTGSERSFHGHFLHALVGCHSGQRRMDLRRNRLSVPWIWCSRCCHCVSFHHGSYTSVSRYFAVVRPNRFKSIFTRRRTTAFIATAWFAAFAISSPPHFFRPSGFQFHPGKVMCLYDFQRDIAYSLFLDLFNVGCTLAVITISYAKIFQEVSRTNKVFSQQNDMDRLRANIKEAKVTKSLVAVVVGFFMCWGPIAVIDVIDMVRRSSTPLPRQVMCC